MTRSGSGSAILMAAGLFALAIGAWQWRASVFQTERAAVDREAWDGIMDEFPLPKESRPSIIGLAPGEVDSATKANPFSPMRRDVPVDPLQGSGSGDGATAKPAQPKFTYKGRILLGSRQRAVVEEMTTGKTHFLEVGQEVAGFKVLDIAESRVLLSDPRTGSEVVLSLNKPGASP